MKKVNVFSCATFKNFVFLLLSCAIFAIATEAEADQQCGNVSSALNPPYISTTGTFRVLVVFVQFQDDVFDGPPTCIANSTNGWPSSTHAIPTWATGSTFLHSQTAAQYTTGSLSHFYDLMSNGTFDLIGDVYPQVYVTPQPKSYYDFNVGRGRGWLNQQIIDWMDPNVNFANYDNDNDGDVDMIIFIYRNWFGPTFNDDSYQGIADLGFTGSITRDGKSILGGFPGSGTSQHNVYTLGDFWNIGIHEISHYQFGGGHFDYIGKFGVHDGNSGGSTMSGYERFLLGWISPTLISSNTSITLTDAATTVNYYRVNIPNSDEYFLLENRQALSVYEQADFCLHTALPATGLMISHIRPSVEKKYQLSWEAADNTFLENEEGQSSDSYKPGNKIQITPWTRPNSDRSNGNFTGIAVTNINQSGNNITADIVLNFSSGIITENSWWEGTETITGNVTVATGPTLNIAAGANVTINPGVTVTVEGIMPIAANVTITGGGSMVTQGSGKILPTNSATALASNNSRKLARDVNGNYHLVFENDGEVCYEKLTNSGAITEFRRLSNGVAGEVKSNPSITIRDNNILVVWQKSTGSSHDITFHKSTDYGATWSTSNRKTLATNVGANPPLPVIASPATNELLVVYRTASNLSYRTSSHNGNTWVAAAAVPSSGAYGNSPSLAATSTYWGSARTVLVNATEGGSGNIFYRYYKNGDSTGWASL